MAPPGYGGALDTPRTNVGDATYLHQPDFADITQEASFHSPPKDGNLFQQMRSGRGASLRTPRRRGPLTDRQNLPPSVGGAEFTPMLKSATRNSVRRNGKENGQNRVSATPAALNRIDEHDITPLPAMDASMYTGSRNQSYLDNTLPQVEASSAASTPIALPRKRDDKGPLNSGKQLSLREQEEEINKIEKLNFSLKLKIHFLEEALRKAGPGFNEAALKENTDLKIDAKLMEREMKRYKKHLTQAERDLEAYRQQVAELHEKTEHQHVSESQRDELDELRRQLDERDATIEDLQSQLDQGQQGSEQVEKLRDDIADLEADLRVKESLVADKDEELEDLKDRFDEADARAKTAERKMQAMEETSGEKDDLEHDIRRMEEEVEDVKDKLEEAIAERRRAEEDLAELQEEMADKSMVTKGSSRQAEEKANRLQQELEESEQAYADLEKQLTEANHQKQELVEALADIKSKQQYDSDDKDRRIQQLEQELLANVDEKDLLETRRDELAGDVQALENEIQSMEQKIAQLEGDLEDERQHAQDLEKSSRDQHRDELERLNDEISDLQAEIREKDNLYDTDSDKWDTERQALESDLQRAQDRAAGLQKTIDQLREAEGSLSTQESKLQSALKSEAERHASEEAALNRRIEELQASLENRLSSLNDLRNQLSTAKDELRQRDVDGQAQIEQMAALEDEIDVLQNALEESNGQREELTTMRHERDELRRQLESAQRRSPIKSPGASTPRLDSAALTKMKWQLSDTTMQLERSTKEKQNLQDKLAGVNAELDAVKSSLSETRAERDELDAELRRSTRNGQETTHIDQDRVELRTAKLKLDSEVRRLKEENRALVDERDAIEKTLDDEMSKAAEEEERLTQEIRQLQSKVRSSTSTDSQDLTAARRQVRDLERKIVDYEAHLAAIADSGDGNRTDGDMSAVRRDLSAARQKELDFLAREAAHRDTVKNLKHQVADLEHQLHEKDIAHFVTSPAVSSRATPSRDSSVQLRSQLTSLRQQMNDMQTRHREAERASTVQLEDLQQQLVDTEDQKIVLEEMLDDARQQAEELVSQHEKALHRLKLKLEKAERDRAALKEIAKGNDPNTDRHLRKSQAEIENLEHDVRQQQDMLDALAASEGSLRRKLERTRAERASFRSAAEKLKREFEKLKIQNDRNEDRQAIETVVRAAESAKDTHKKEIRGVVMQMEWMQARWEREAGMRSDAAYAKKFLQLQLEVANACNKAQLRELESIRTRLLGSRAPAPSTTRAQEEQKKRGKPTLRNVFMAARFIAKMKISAKNWAKQEVVKRKLVEEYHGQRRVKRTRGLRVVSAETA